MSVESKTTEVGFPKSTITSIDEIENKMNDLGLFPSPGEKCSLGVSIPLSANHYKISFKDKITVYQYDVTIKKNNSEEEIESKSLSKQLFSELKKRYPKILMFYDYKRLLYSLTLLPTTQSDDLIFENFILNRMNFVMKLSYTRNVIIDPANVEEVSIQALQLMITDNLNNRFIPVMRSYYIRDLDKVNLGFNIDLWKGFYVSVRPSDNGFQLNVDVANGVFFNMAEVVTLACEWYQTDEKNLEKASSKDDNGSGFINNLIGRTVKTYLNFKKNIINVGPVAALHKIDVDGKQMTIQEYFLIKKNIKLKFPNLRCLDLGQNKKFTTYLPIELAQTQLSHQKNLTPSETKDVIKATAVPCQKRQYDINHRIELADINSSELLKANLIITELKMAELNGQVINPPDLDYGNNIKVVSKSIGREGKWDNIKKIFHNTIKLDSWIAISFGQRIKEDTLNDFMSSIPKVAYNHGIEINEPLDYIFGNPKLNEANALKFFQNACSNYKNLKFVFVILPGTTPIYSALKTFGEINGGVLTQAIDEGTINRQKGKYDRLVSNLCMKINAKLGGTNFILSASNNLFKQYLQELYNGPLMIFGADVNHSTHYNNDVTESIAAVVGSIDPECCYYAARIQSQQHPKAKSLELIYDLKTMVKELLDENYKRNQKYPKRLVFLRDGVSDGHFKKVRNHEMNEIRAACQMINTGYKPGITFVIVKKRHHTRLFPKNQEDQSGRNGNIPPGTYVDCNIITPNMFNFFLCSHMGIQGTSKPCHYFVLHDDNNFKTNQIALLCYYLCHIYAKSTTSVSYPAPTYYADLCAERGRLYIRDQMPINQTQITVRNIQLHNICKNKMFFI